jgi:hypothetical protein
MFPVFFFPDQRMNELQKVGTPQTTDMASRRTVDATGSMARCVYESYSLLYWLARNRTCLSEAYSHSILSLKQESFGSHGLGKMTNERETR